MTPQERKIVYALAEVWNEFLKLPNEHEDDNAEFRRGIHQLQYMIMARAARYHEKMLDDSIAAFSKAFTTNGGGE